MLALPQIALLRILLTADAHEPTLQFLQELGMEPAPVAYVRAIHAETVIRGRPWVPHKRIATLTKGTRLAVRGQVKSRDPAGCEGKNWYAVLPFGFVCSTHVVPSDSPPDPDPALTPNAGRRLPFTYALVQVEGTPLFADAAQIETGLPSRTLTKGMSLALRRSTTIGTVRYVETTEGELVPRSGVAYLGEGSQWRGIALPAAQAGPLLAWVGSAGASVHQDPDVAAPVVRKLPRREVVWFHAEHATADHTVWWNIGEQAWVRASQLNEVVIRPPPDDVLSDYRRSVPDNNQWVDVDLGEQVLVAYRDELPIFATLVSSGRSFPTPRGNYPVWAKVTSMTMANQDYEDSPYMVQGVPWVLLFQGHNALHGAYWHDRFGQRKSHGCINLSPLDARWLFEWLGPTLPAGWTGYLPGDLQKSPVIHIRDSSRPGNAAFTQDRPIGPPDSEAEKKKVEEAMLRRAALAAEQETNANLILAGQASPENTEIPAPGQLPNAVPLQPAEPPP